MAKLTSLNILEEKNVIDDHLLDIIGNDFKFSHEKGLGEWLKNSVDAYIRAGIPDTGQYVIFRFTDGRKDNASFECIDFVGMTETDIIKAFKRWGDPEAARRGLKKRTYGGHGNGGKFYMRQMFDHSHFVTYRDGFLNIFGFSERKHYGFAKGYKNKKMKPKDALELAEIDGIIFPAGVKEKIFAGKTGFTVVKGFAPAGMKNKIRVGKIIEKFKNYPHSRRILLRINVSVIHNGTYLYDLLHPNEIPPLPGFEEPRIIFIPRTLNLRSGKEKIKVTLANQKFQRGKLVLKTSEEALGRSGKLSDLNRIDFIGEIGVVASYQIFELGVSNFPQAAFIYGECECPILEDPKHDCVRNDREKLVENETSRVLRQWVAEKIDGLASEIGAREQKERSEQMKKLSSGYNEVLNRWKDKFMKKVFSEIFGGGTGIGTEEGGGSIKRKNLEVPENGLEFSFKVAEIPIDQEWPITLKAAVPDPIPFGAVISIISDNPSIKTEDNKITVKSDVVKLTEEGETVAVINIKAIGKRIGEEGKIIARAGKYTDEIKIKVVETKSGSGKKPRYPKVLLSGQDPDPLDIAPEGTVILSPRDPLVFQRPQDVKEGIYWINTSSPLADAILKNEKGGAESTRWRDYLFQRYVDIFVKEALYEAQKKDPENFRADIIDNQIMGELIRKIHAAAVVDLEQFLLGETYVPSVPEDRSSDKS